MGVHLSSQVTTGRQWLTPEVCPLDGLALDTILLPYKKIGNNNVDEMALSGSPTPQLFAVSQKPGLGFL